MTTQSLDARDHFRHKHSGFSTLRRSLGAILKNELSLSAIPRSPGPSRSNLNCYRFAGDGETRLSAWMEDNLVGAQEVLDRELATREQQLIAFIEPPLNLTGWSNPQRRLIKGLRAECVRETSSVGSSRE